MKRAGRVSATILFLLSAILLFWFLLPLTSGIFDLGNGLGIAFSLSSVAVIGLVVRWNRQGRRKRAMLLTWIGGIIAGIILAWAAVLSGLMISGAMEKPHSPQATVVVLGCKVKGETPSLHLSRRIEAAAEYLKAHPDAHCVASGGKGNGERISEAEAIARGLTAAGISPERIALEDASVNTLENLTFSKALIEQQGWDPELVLITDDFHQYRAGHIAKGLGLTVSPVNAKHTWHTFPANYARELLAITKELLFPAKSTS
ncbi:MAG: YdcF family protein [Oscillospiraceae bacterium]|nr:YdcF family protein [Oscillospiraceae bacterium]